MSSNSPSKRSTSDAVYSAPVVENWQSDLEPLRRPLTSFVGRDSEITTVASLLRRPDIRLLTLTGTGGVGKTRLALRVAEVSRDTFDSTVFVPLAPVRDPTMLLPTVAQYLSVPDASDKPVLSRLQAFLAAHQLLLVLDNVEHLLEAVPDVADLLATCPRLTILCTCRTNLNVSGEHLLPLAPLSVEEARTLFIERVRALVPSFTVTDGLVPTIDAICARLDGLPLAIELAASRVPTLPPRALLARLEHRLDLLTNGPRDAPPRLRGMRAAIAWSYELLPPDQQRLFRHIGVFIGGFTLKAAEAVAGDGVDMFDALSALTAASLVVPIEGVADEARYTMLETIREYALERLIASGQEAIVRMRHAEYYRWLAEDALPLYDGPLLRLACDRVDIELDNCRAAMAWLLDVQDAETGTRLAGALWRVWQFGRATTGRPWMECVAEGQDWIERMLTMQARLPVEAMTEALIGVGALARLQGNTDRAQAAVEELLARARAEGYSYGEFWAIGVLGMLAVDRGQFDAARSYYGQGLTLAPDMRNPQNHLALAYFSLGMVALRSGDLTQAAQELDEALRLSHETGNTQIVAQVAASLGRVMRERGDLHRAASLTRESITSYLERGYLPGVHASLIDLALLTLMTDHPERAARLLGVAGTLPAHEADADVSAHAVTSVQERLGEAAFVTEADAGRRLAWAEVRAEIDALVEAASEATTAPPPTSATAHGLSRREVEVLQLLVEGQSNRAIAEALCLSERTIQNHVFHIFNKLSVNSRAAAAAHAVRHGLT